jgi:NitT/TauT family transport system permease protein
MSCRRHTISSVKHKANGTAMREPGRWKQLIWWIWPTILVLAILGLWQSAVRIFEIPHWKLPAPWAIATELVESRELLFRHTWVTLREILIGFFIALTAGIALASMIAYSQTFQRAIYPLVIASQTIPIIVISPLLLIWVGYGLAPKVIIVGLIAFFPIVVNTADGMRGVDQDMVKLMRTLGASRWQIFIKIQVPTSLPFLFSGMKVAVTASVIGAVVGEWVGANAGLGYLTKMSVPLFQTARSFAAVAILAFMGVVLFAAVSVLERLLLPWHNTDKGVYG